MASTNHTHTHISYTQSKVAQMKLDELEAVASPASTENSGKEEGDDDEDADSEYNEDSDYVDATTDSRVKRSRRNVTAGRKAVRDGDDDDDEEEVEEVDASTNKTATTARPTRTRRGRKLSQADNEEEDDDDDGGVVKRVVGKRRPRKTKKYDVDDGEVDSDGEVAENTRSQPHQLPAKRSTRSRRATTTLKHAESSSEEEDGEDEDDDGDADEDDYDAAAGKDKRPSRISRAGRPIKKATTRSDTKPVKSTASTPADKLPLPELVYKEEYGLLLPYEDVS